jgi:DnaK suppressor protein
VSRREEPPKSSRTGDYHRILLDRRAELRSSLEAKVAAVATLGRVAEEDQAQISHDEYVSSSLNILDYAQLRMIDEALDRLRTGDFGLCLACGEPIPHKRLSAIPWARHCVPCQEREGSPITTQEIWEAEPSHA